MYGIIQCSEHKRRHFATYAEMLEAAGAWEAEVNARGLAISYKRAVVTFFSLQMRTVETDKLNGEPLLSFEFTCDSA